MLKFITVQDLYLLLVIGLLKMADRCRLNQFLSPAVAFIALHLSRRRRKLRERNLSQTLALSETEVHNIVKRCFYDSWDEIFSLSRWRNGNGLQIRAEFRGLEHLQEALGKRHGVILWEGSSFGRRLLATRILHENGFSVCQIHGENHMGGFYNAKSWISRRAIQPFFDNCERQFVKAIIYLSHPDSLAFTRDLLERLKQNSIISITANGKQGRKFIPVKFLGRMDSFSTGMVSLARYSGAVILPLFCVQDGRRTCLIIESPIRIEADEDRERSLERCVLQYVSLLESYIKRYPEQYHNWEGLGGLDNRAQS